MSRSRFVTAIVAFPILLLGVTPAYAHDVYTERLWNGNTIGIDLCVDTWSEVSHGSYNAGYQKGYIFPTQRTDTDCDSPGGNIRVALYEDLYVTYNNGGSWQECTTWGFFYDKYYFEKHYTYDTPPCGDGLYGVYIGAWGWRGNAWYPKDSSAWVWSGAHVWPVPGGPTPNPQPGPDPHPPAVVSNLIAQRLHNLKPSLPGNLPAYPIGPLAPTTVG
jgi:hypothetical protein